MNKKLMSLVLAAAFVTSLGAVSWARVDLGNVGDVFSTGGGSTSQIGITINNSDLTKFAETTLGNLVTVFGYAAGTMTYAASKTGIQFFDSKGLKAAYTVTENANGGYNYDIAALNISSSDRTAITNAGGLKQFLLNCGIDQSALQTVSTNANGDIQFDANGNEVMMDAAWLADGTVTDWLDRGLNFSATISLGGSDPTVTLSENGKEAYTYGTFKGASTMLTEYNYSNGFLSSTTNLQLKADMDASGKIISYHGASSVTEMDSFGRQSKVYEIDGTNRQLTTEFNYSNNGSLSTYTDMTTGDTYHYVAGQMSYITNNEGKVTSQRNYKDGILRSVQSFGSDGVVSSTTIFDDFGRNLGTVEGNVDYSTAKAAIIAVLNTPDGVTSSTASNCKVQSVQIYKDYVGKYAFASDLASQANKTYGNTTAIAERRITTGGTDTSGKTTDDTTVATTELKGVHTVTVAGVQTTINIDSVGVGSSGDNAGKSLDIAAMSRADAEALCRAAGIEINDDNIKQISSVSGTGVTDTTLYTINGASNVQKAMSALGISNVTTTTDRLGVGASLMSASYKTTTTRTVTQAYAKITTTCYVQGIRTKSYEKSLGYSERSTSAISTSTKDPVVTGTLLGTTVVDGRTYAMVGNADVNIMDGTGFKAAEGETIMVDITGNEAMINVAAGEKVMFMGDVAQSVNGHLAIAMNTNYGGGFIQGTSAVEAAKIEITEKSQAVARARDGLELGTITQSEFNKIVEEAGWVGNNTAANLEMFAKGNFSWDENKTPIQNLRDAWNLLLSF